MKLCRSCEETKPNTAFHKSSRAKSGLQTYCKACQVEMDNENPNRNQRYQRYRAKWPGRTTWSFVKKRAERLGIAVSPMAEFVSWYNDAARHCVYCGMKEDEAKARFSRNLHIDRKQGGLGYVVGNMVLACRRCNEVKSAHLSHDQMMQVAGMFFGGPVNNHEALVSALREIGLACDGPLSYSRSHLADKVAEIARDALLGINDDVGDAGQGKSVSQIQDRGNHKV